MQLCMCISLTTCPCPTAFCVCGLRCWSSTPLTRLWSLSPSPTTSCSPSSLPASPQRMLYACWLPSACVSHTVKLKFKWLLVEVSAEVSWNILNFRCSFNQSDVLTRSLLFFLRTTHSNRLKSAAAMSTFIKCIEVCGSSTRQNSYFTAIPKWWVWCSQVLFWNMYSSSLMQ